MREADCEVAIIGGNLAGGMAAMLLRKRGLRTVVLEARPAGKEQKVVVGEAITEGSSVFLRHELGLTEWLAKNAFRKFGFDFLTLPRAGAPAETLEDCHELLFSLAPLGRIPAAKKRLIPTFHVERTGMNAHVGGEARAAGAAWIEGGTVVRVDLGDGGALHTLHYTLPGGTSKSLTCKWVLDCTGRRALLGRQLGITHPVNELDTASVWNRFEGVNADPEVWRSFHGVDRRQHTIHMTGAGFWIWWIHQNDRMTSVGISYDREQHRPDIKTEDRGFWEMVSKFPPILPLLDGARALEPFQYYAHLAYRSDHWISPAGYALIGDAGWFTDALYSTGIETACRQLMNAVGLIVSACRGEPVETHKYETLNEELRYTQDSVLKINQFKYRRAWAHPHVVAQTALYELGDITELYYLQEPSQWTEERRSRWYHLPWYNQDRYDRLSRFLDGSTADADRDLLPGAGLYKKALLPGPLVYASTWPLWRIAGATPYFFKIIRGWAHSERFAQRHKGWPDLLAWMASESEVGALLGRGVRPLEKERKAVVSGAPVDAAIPTNSIVMSPGPIDHERTHSASIVPRTEDGRLQISKPETTLFNSGSD